MPVEGKNKLYFTNFYRRNKVPFILYADFEALIKKRLTIGVDPILTKCKNIWFAGMRKRS